MADWGTDTSAPAVDTSWDNSATAVAADNWSSGDTYTGIDPAQISKHEGTVGNGYTCRNCGEQGHFSKDCTSPSNNTGECYNCGQTGHNKAECTNERVEREFTGTCRICDQIGHRGADCPSKPPQTCKRCNETGHSAQECTNVYKLFDDTIVAIDSDEAWARLKKVDAERDLDDFKKAFYVYCKSSPDMTLPLLQNSFRETKMVTWLVARQQEVSPTHTIVDLQGKTDCQFVVSFQYGLAPRRAKTAGSWPKTEEENMERLANAGFPMDRMVPLCSNCSELGHTARRCPEERREIEKPKIVCGNCNQDGHYVRDCPEPREDRNACRNCKQSGHRANECTEPRNADNVECRICTQMGHFSKDCPDAPKFECRNCGEEGHRASDCTQERKITCRNCGQDGHMSRECPEPRNMANMQCRNCDEMGHSSRECPKPTDYSKVQCRNCGEMGHGAGRCRATSKEETNDSVNNFGIKPTNESVGSGGAPTGGWDTADVEDGGVTAVIGNW